MRVDFVSEDFKCPLSQFLILRPVLLSDGCLYELAMILAYRKQTIGKVIKSVMNPAKLCDLSDIEYQSRVVLLEKALVICSRNKDYLESMYLPDEVDELDKPYYNNTERRRYLSGWLVQKKKNPVMISFPRSSIAGNNIAHLAAKSGHAEVLEFLLANEDGRKLFLTCNVVGWTPWEEACRFGQLAVVGDFKEQIVSLQCEFDTRFCLVRACIHGENTQKVKELYRFFPECFYLHDEPDCYFHWLTCAQMDLHWFDVIYQLDSAFMYARGADLETVSHVLLQIPVFELRKNYISHLLQLDVAKQLFATANKMGRTVIQLATRRQLLSTVKLLTNLDASLVSQLSGDTTAVHLAAKQVWFGALLFFHQILGRGIWRLVTSKGDTPLHFLARSCDHAQWQRLRSWISDTSLMRLQNNAGETVKATRLSQLRSRLILPTKARKRPAVIFSETGSTKAFRQRF